MLERGDQVITCRLGYVGGKPPAIDELDRCGVQIPSGSSQQRGEVSVFGVRSTLHGLVNDKLTDA